MWRGHIGRQALIEQQIQSAAQLPADEHQQLVQTAVTLSLDAATAWLHTDCLQEELMAALNTSTVTHCSWKGCSAQTNYCSCTACLPL